GFTTLLMMTGFILFFSIVGMLDTSVAEKARSGFNIAQMKLIYGISRLPVSEHSFAELLRSHPPVFTAATKIIIDIMSISFMTTTALGVATATLVSQNIGKRRPDESAAYAWESVKLGVTLMLVIGGIAFFYPEGYLGIFSQDSEVIEAGMEPLRLMGGAHFLLGIGMILAQALYGAGNTKYVMWVEMFLHFFCLVPLSYFLGIYIDLGLTGIWVAGAIYLFLVSAAMVWKFREGKWKEIRL
ncbi:MAG: hypothetical protein FJ088_13285, partial [Deltaproteobacteria bacterium]|nr:hypothetical protein [Deltaproteobacteria bacterium]